MTADDSSLRIRPMTADDWPRVEEIYAQGIATGDATMETDTPSWEEWDDGYLAACRLVAEWGGRVVGWAALAPVSGRCVYDGVAEVSVYVAEGVRGRGMGTRLLAALVDASEEEGYWTLEAGVFPENEASLRVFEKAGFRRVGLREGLGRQGERWRDVVLMERRSDRVGAPS